MDEYGMPTKSETQTDRIVYGGSVCDILRTTVWSGGDELFSCGRYGREGVRIRLSQWYSSWRSVIVESGTEEDVDRR